MDFLWLWHGVFSTSRSLGEIYCLMKYKRTNPPHLFTYVLQCRRENILNVIAEIRLSLRKSPKATLLYPLLYTNKNQVKSHCRLFSCSLKCKIGFVVRYWVTFSLSFFYKISTSHEYCFLFCIFFPPLFYHKDYHTVGDQIICHATSNSEKSNIRDVFNKFRDLILTKF